MHVHKWPFTLEVNDQIHTHTKRERKKEAELCTVMIFGLFLVFLFYSEILLQFVALPVSVSVPSSVIVCSTLPGITYASLILRSPTYFFIFFWFSDHFRLSCLT